MLELTIISLAVISGFAGSSWAAAVILSFCLAALSALDQAACPISATEPRSMVANLALIAHFFSGAMFALLAFGGGRMLVTMIGH